MNYNDFYEKNGKKISKTDKQVAEDPKWHKIRNNAKKIYDDLNQLLIKKSDQPRR